MRERNGQTLPVVCKSEDQAVPAIRSHVANGATVYADEASMWDQLHASYSTRRIDHSVEYANDDASINCASQTSKVSRLAYEVLAKIGTGGVIPKSNQPGGIKL